MEAQSEKVMEAIYICCFGRDPTSIEVDEKQLCIRLTTVFPSVGQPEMSRIVKDNEKRVAQGGDNDKYSEPKPLSKEVVQLQKKDIQFLKQNMGPNVEAGDHIWCARYLLKRITEQAGVVLTLDPKPIDGD